MKLDPKWSFILTVLLFAGMMIGLSISILTDYLSQAAPLAGRDIFVMTMHLVWLLLWCAATVFALKYALRPKEFNAKHKEQAHRGAPISARSPQNPATSEY